MKLQLINKLQQADHWELIEDLSKYLYNSSVAIKDFHGSLDHIGERRVMIAAQLAKVDVLKDAIRMKFSIMDGEWSQELEAASNDIEQQFDREFHTNIVSSIPEGLV